MDPLIRSINPLLYSPLVLL